MCGIAGYVGADATAQRDWLEQATSSLRHRGPDASGSRAFPSCLLGHRRLRILDLSADGDQPMSNETETVWVIFNGEVYNFDQLRRELEDRGHAFRSRTDTEVIVHGYEEWGDGVADRLEGMFAFAVWDEPRERLLVVRDRLGIKPLYYAAADGGIFFASESRALPRLGQVSRDAVASYLRLGWVPGPGTIHAGVNELDPGHRLIWERGEVTSERWWEPRRGSTQGGVEELREALALAVRRQLVSDVPVGVFLSSGLDSSAIATLAAGTAANFAGYTVTFDHPDDEAPAASELAAQLGIPHVTVPVEGQEILSALPEVISSMDQPTVDGVNTWVVSRAVRQAGAVVALSGVGGDELFAGYSTFRYVPQFAAISHAIRDPGRRLLGAGARLGLRSGATAHSRYRRVAEAVAASGPSEAYAAVRGTFSAAELSWLRGEEPPAVNGSGVRAADSVTELELTNYLPYQLLRDSDAMSMAHSLELRVPLLDEAVVRAAMDTGGSEGTLRGKELLASAVDPSLLRIARGRKRTFTLPFDSWLRNELSSWSRDAVGHLGTAGLGFRGDRLLTFWERFQRGRADWRPLWSLAVLGQWLTANQIV